MDPWPKLMPPYLFSLLKFAVAKLQSEDTSIDVKTCSPDLVDFATTRLLLCRLWNNGQSPLAYHAVTAAICTAIARYANTQHLVFCVNYHKSVVHLPRLWQFAQWLCNHRHITSITSLYANELEAALLQIQPGLENWFLHWWMGHSMVFSLVTPSL
jgi:hypothetical protein